MASNNESPTKGDKFKHRNALFLFLFDLNENIFW